MIQAFKGIKYLQFKYGDLVSFKDCEFLSKATGAVVGVKRHYLGGGTSGVIYTVRLTHGELIEVPDTDLTSVEDESTIKKGRSKK